MNLYSERGGLLSIWNHLPPAQLNEGISLQYYGRYLDFWSKYFLSASEEVQKQSERSLRSIRGAYIDSNFLIDNAMLLTHLRQNGDGFSPVGKIEYWSMPPGAEICTNCLNPVEFPRLSNEDLNIWMHRVPEWSNSISASCQAFIAAEESGALDAYLPSRTHHLAHPSTEGSRPSTEGSRPSTEGSRPDGRSVRPCLKPDDRF